MRQARLLAICAVLTLFALVRGASAQPLLANGTFATGGTPPSGWYLDPATARKGALSFRPAPAGTAGQVLVLSPNPANTPSNTPYGIGQVLPAASVRGRVVRVTALLGNEPGAQAVLGLVVLRSGTAGAQVRLRGDGPLGRKEAQLTVPNDASVEGLILFLVAEGTAGVASFADVSVQVAGEAAAVPPVAAAPVPRTGTRPDADIPARVRIDITRQLRTIPNGLFGTNVEVIRDANGLWDSKLNQLDPQIVGLARDLGLGPIRFPGGVWADAYDWRNGIGPRERRATTPTHPGANETFRHNFGTDEALRLAKEAGTSLLITVNAATGTAQMAADWVRYVNGEGGRTPRGPRVELWQVGNELYIEGDASGGHMTPQAYADRFLNFAAAMKAVDPTIRIGAIGLRNYGRYQLNKFDDWNEVVLRRAGAAIDLFTVHNAYAPVVGDDGGLDPAEVYAAMWAAPALIARNLADTWSEVQRFAPLHASRIRLAVTEWGPLFAISPGSPWIDHVKTLGSAIFIAATLKVFAEQPNLEVANFFKLNEHLFMGWIARRNAGGPWVATAPYLALRMISRDMERGLLGSSVDVARYDSQAVGFVDAVAGVPYLDVLATASPDGRSVTALLINKSLTSAIDGRITLAGATGTARLVTTTLSGAAADAHTGTTLPRIPGIAWGAQQSVGPQGRINRGGPDEVRLVRDERASPGGEVQVRVPPHSLMLLRFDGVAR